MHGQVYFSEKQTVYTVSASMLVQAVSQLSLVFGHVHCKLAFASNLNLT